MESRFFANPFALQSKITSIKYNMAETKDSAPAATPTPEWTYELQSDLENLLTVGEECISENELKNLLLYCANAKKRFNLYDGFEPSGRMHIAQGVFKV